VAGQALKESDVDGVRTVWTPSSGTFTAVLSFRAGRADETLATSGISHLSEHLALYGLGRDGHPVRFNGRVDDVTTSFVFQGAPEDVVGALAKVCHDLHDPPIERLDVERQILLSEEDQRSTRGALPSMLRRRYGSATFGLAAYAELGLRRLQADDLASWTSAKYTSGNAVLAIAGTLPPGLRLPLPDGHAAGPPTPSSALERTPGWYGEGGGTASLLTTVKRSSAVAALRFVLDKALTSRLRYELGASYSPMVGYEPRDGNYAHLWAVAEAVEGKGREVTRGVLELINDAARQLPAVTAIEQWRASVFEQQNQPGFAENWAFGYARDLLLGAPKRTYEQLLEEASATGPEQVRDAAVEAAWNALYRLPKETTHLPGLTLTPVWSRAEIRGTSFAPVGQARSASSLVAGPSGTMIIVRGVQRITVLTEDVSALLSWPSGRRMLIGRDGFSLDIDPAQWDNGTAATALIDAHVPAAKVVPMPESPEEAGLDQTPRKESTSWLWPLRKHT